MNDADMQGQVNQYTPKMLLFTGPCPIWPSLCCPQVMKKSVIGADFEKKDAVPPYQESKQALKLKRRASLTFLLHTTLARVSGRGRE